MKFNTKAMGFKLWAYYILFSAVILSLLWLLQTVFLRSFYEGMKVNGIAKIADTIISKYGQDDFEATIDQLVFKNSILAFITDTQGNVIYTSDEHGPGDFRNGGQPNGKRTPASQTQNPTRPLPREYDEFLARINQSKDNRISYTVSQDKFNGKTLIYGARLQDNLLYISTPLDPVDATTGILKTQLAYVTVIALFLGSVIAYFLARKLAKPISKITTTAGQLAAGNYNIHFDKGYYSEISELAATLNHTAKELSKVEKLRRELIANISHDFRTPLTMIKAYTEMIRDISGDNREKREAHLKVIVDEADRLSLLVNDILDLSVLQSASETVKQNNINLSDTVKRVLSRFEPLAAHEGYTIKDSIEQDLYVLADEVRLEQVFYNLIGNAVNHIGDDKVIQVNLIDLGSRVRFEVKDKGCGIPEEELHFIWDRYYKSKNQKRTIAGTGLGLSIVKSILEMHGAAYGAESSVGNGSLFWFELKK